MIGRLKRNQDLSEPSSTQRQQGRRRWNDGLFYELQLNGPSPDRLLVTLDDPYKADSADAEELISLYSQEEEHISSIDQHHDGFLTPWLQLDQDTLQYHRFHIFRWLSGFVAQGEAGRPVAQALTDGWLALNGRYSPDTWEPRLASERLWQLARHGNWLMQGADAMWRSRMLTSMARQTRHLAKAVSRIEEPTERLFTAMTLVLMGLGLPHHRICEEQGNTLLRRELRLQLRADGGHISRNPSLQLKIAAGLQALLLSYKKTQTEAPNYLHHAVGRTTDMAEFFRCGDGRMAVFNEGTEDDPKALASVLAFDSIGRNRIDFASQSGFQKLSGARAVLYVDIGVPGQKQSGKKSATGIHKGTFSIQFSSGRQRIITNCGAARALATPSADLTLAEYQDWRKALASADAHSGLCIDVDAKETGRRPAEMLEERAYHRLEEDRQGQLLDLERVGLRDAPGSTHRRRLFLSVDGDDLRGEDVLIPPAGGVAPNWYLRFHLYPSIKASLSRDGRSVILVSPQNEGWRFIAGDSRIELNQSIYCGVSGPVQKTQQIVVRPPRDNRTVRVIKWALKK